MKKLISIILSLTLVACMFAMNVGAAHTVGGDNGTASFDPTNFAKDVTLKLGTAASRYAVDIEFGGDYVLTVNNLVWNVNELIYEIDGDTIDAQEYTFTVKNYSDKDITASVTGVVNTTVTALEKLAITFTTDETKTILGNLHGADKLNPSNYIFKATLDATTSWTEVINNLVESKDAKEVKLATFTVNVAMA